MDTPVIYRATLRSFRRDANISEAWERARNLLGSLTKSYSATQSIKSAASIPADKLGHDSPWPLDQLHLGFFGHTVVLRSEVQFRDGKPYSFVSAYLLTPHEKQKEKHLASLWRIAAGDFRRADGSSLLADESRANSWPHVFLDEIEEKLFSCGLILSSADSPAPSAPQQ